MHWNDRSVMDQRLQFNARPLAGESMTDICREFGISRNTGYNVFQRHMKSGSEAQNDQCRPPVRYAN